MAGQHRFISAELSEALRADSSYDVAEDEDEWFDDDDFDRSWEYDHAQDPRYARGRVAHLLKIRPTTFPFDDLYDELLVALEAVMLGGSAQLNRNVTRKIAEAAADGLNLLQVLDLLQFGALLDGRLQSAFGVQEPHQARPTCAYRESRRRAVHDAVPVEGARRSGPQAATRTPRHRTAHWSPPATAARPEGAGGPPLELHPERPGPIVRRSR